MNARRSPRLLACVALAGAALLAAPAVRALAPGERDVAGAWTLVAPSPEDTPVELRLDLRAQQGRIIGVAVGVGGPSEVRGHLRGDRVWLTTERPGLGGPYTLKLAGRLAAGAIRGRVVVPPRGHRRDRRHRPFVALRR